MKKRSKKNTEAPEQSNLWKKGFKISGILVLAGLILGLLIVFILSSNLASLQNLEQIEPAVATRMYSSNGELIHELFTYNRLYIPYSQIPPHLIKALIATEDKSFYSHWGVNLKGIPRAILVNLKSMSFTQGFSTITMQLARNIYQRDIGFEKSIFRKIKEILTAIELERRYSKEEILEMYLNIAYFGHGAYGIEAASHTFFDKPAQELTMDESALLVALLKAPSRYSPYRYPERALMRRNVVLKNMVQSDYLPEVAFDTLKIKGIDLKTENDSTSIAPYFTEQVRIQLNALQDSLGVNVYEDGLHVYTTLDTRLQWAMDSAVTKHYQRLQDEIRNDSEKEEMREELGDTLFNEKTVLQLGFIVIEPQTGDILAMIGGADFSKYKYNHVTQARRQPGSAFKPFVYTAAIDNGYLPTDKYLDQPIVIPEEDGTRWTPKNYDGSVSGPMPLREALRRSRNLPTIRLIVDIGPRVVADYAKKMGISSRLSPYPSLALGSSDVKPIEIINAYTVFVNQGVLVQPRFITKIEDRFGNIIYQKNIHKKAVLSPVTAYIVNTMLQDVINRGTGGSARWLYHFYKTAAGKTGTTNDYTDAWFIGFTPHLVAGIWTGLDDHSISLGKRQTGAHTALPFWADFMKMAYDTLKYPDEQFQIPTGVVIKKVCKETYKLATSFCPEVYEEYFHENHVLQETCDKHGNNKRGGKILF
ncbi:MAG: PBP1A family penicillin-binding protein [Calditrichia bacterium]